MHEQQPIVNISTEVIVAPTPAVEAPKTVVNPVTGQEHQTQPFFFFRHRELLK